MPETTTTLSSNTFGIRASGDHSFDRDWKALGALEYAHQSDARDNPVDYSHNYYNIEAGVGYKSLTVTAQDLDFSNEATEQMACTLEGTPMRIAFNAKFLAEMLGVLDTEEIKIELSTPSRAGILTPVEEPNKDREILMLVMPVMLNG